jgi:hypothetical protein
MCAYAVDGNLIFLNQNLLCAINYAMLALQLIPIYSSFSLNFTPNAEFELCNVSTATYTHYSLYT